MFSNNLKGGLYYGYGNLWCKSIVSYVNYDTAKMEIGKIGCTCLKHMPLKAWAKGRSYGYVLAD